jgi:hypothetical protein
MGIIASGEDESRCEHAGKALFVGGVHQNGLVRHGTLSSQSGLSSRRSDWKSLMAINEKPGLEPRMRLKMI